MEHTKLLENGSLSGGIFKLDKYCKTNDTRIIYDRNKRLKGVMSDDTYAARTWRAI